MSKQSSDLPLFLQMQYVTQNVTNTVVRMTPTPTVAVIPPITEEDSPAKHKKSISRTGFHCDDLSLQKSEHHYFTMILLCNQNQSYSIIPRQGNVFPNRVMQWNEFGNYMSEH